MGQPVKSKWQRSLLTIGSCVLLGLIIAVSGTGKLPGQTEFFDVLLRSFWTPTIAKIIVHGLPWAELILGVLLLLRIFPRIAAAVCLPLIFGFMSSNAWAISHGEKFGQCGCFGIFEELFGSMTPWQSLGLDIVMLCLALIIVLFHPTGFLKFQWWFSKQKEKEEESKKEGESK